MKTHIARLFLLLFVGLSFVACGDKNTPPDNSDAKINIAAITGVTIPARGNAPVTSITETAQYTGTVTWSPAVSGEFAAKTVYTATITLAPKTGYTLQGVAANFFTVAGSVTATNAANSGVVVAAFPATAIPDPEWEIPEDYVFSIEVFDGATSLGAFDVETLAAVEQVILTSETGRVMPSYLLTEVLQAAGISIPEDYEKVSAQRAVVDDPSDDVTEIADITKAFLVLARIDPGNETTVNYPRIIADGTINITTSSIRQGFEQLVFTPVSESEPEPEWEIPATYNAAVEVFNGATSIGTVELTATSLTGVEQTILTSTGGRILVTYLLTDVLEAAGISIPAVYDSVAGQTITVVNPLNDVTEIADITKAYVVVARIDEATPATYEPYPRLIADGTVDFGNSAIRQGFEQLVFTPIVWEIPAGYNASFEVFDDATSIGTVELTAASLAGIEQTILTSTGGRILVTYLLTDVLDAAGISLPALYDSVAGQRITVVNPSNDVTEIADITKAYVVVALISDTPPVTYEPYPRLIADGTVDFGNNAIRQGFEQLVFTP